MAGPSREGRIEGTRALWLEDHLLGDAAGAAAHAKAKLLGPEIHLVLLELGDRLAGSSAVVAQGYYRRAAEAWEAFGPEGFRHWFGHGEALALGEPICREGAMAYFAVRPQGFGPAGVSRTDDWCALGREMVNVSPKLGALFFKTTSAVLGRPDAARVLSAWSTVAADLYRQHGWQGEFLAHAYLASAPRAVEVLHPECYRLWAGAGAALYPTIREKEFFGNLPRCLERWPAEDQAALLRVVLAFARAMPGQGYAVYRELPDSLEQVSSAVRGRVLGILLGASRRATATVAEVVPVIGALLRRIPEGLREEALAHLERVGEESPEAVVAGLRVLPRVYEEAEPRQVAIWFDTGLRVAKENSQAGLAYFALESRTGLKVLGAGSTASTLEECQGLLRKYIQMLSGEPASIRGVDGTTLRPPVEEFPQENEVGLPFRIDHLSTYEENLRLHRFLAAQVAGRREFGTYTFSPPDGDPDAPPGGALRRYLESAAHGDLLEALFLLAEGFRIQARLCATYRGLSDEARGVASAYLESLRGRAPRDRSERVDALFALALLGDDAARTADVLVGEPASLVRASVKPLDSADASVEDSMRIAQALTGALAARESVVARGELDRRALFIDDLNAGALFDPCLDDEDSLAAAGEASERTSEAERAVAADLLEGAQVDLEQQPDEGPGGARALSADELKRLLESGADLRITPGTGSDVESVGLYITDLLGKIPAEQIEALRQLLGSPEDAGQRAPRRWLDGRRDGVSFWYDEWDFHIGDYRSRWCRLRELSLEGDSGEFFNRTLGEYARLIPEVRRQFQRIRPEMYRTVKGLEDGEDFDLNAAVDARVDVRAGRAPTGKLYVARKREERDVATLFLVDMSASTDEPLVEPASLDTAGVPGLPAARGRTKRPRRIIDVTKETLVVMAAALEEIGDAYAIYGFSGHGRENVEVYRIKSFSESLNSTVKGRLGGIEPRRSTRMGTALRHAVEKLAGVSSRSKHLFLLSDGFPQDFDYGQDRRSNVYGIRDTAVALREAQSTGISPFCITVDKAGHDYLRQMCDENRYMVIEDIAALPRELPKIYQRVVRA